MADINIAVISGVVSREPRITETQNGSKKLAFSVMTEETGFDGERKFKTYHNVVAWGKTAENAAGIIEGNRASVAGSMSSRKYEDRDGNERRIHEITAKTIEFDGRPAPAADYPAPPAQEPEDDLPF
jgi:single-strand DNA-binding protein